MIYLEVLFPKFWKRGVWQFSKPFAPHCPRFSIVSELSSGSDAISWARFVLLTLLESLVGLEEQINSIHITKFKRGYVLGFLSSINNNKRFIYHKQLKSEAIWLEILGRYNFRDFLVILKERMQWLGQSNQFLLLTLLDRYYFYTCAISTYMFIYRYQSVYLFIYLFVDIYLLLMINILMLVRGSSLVLESWLISITIISHYTHMEIQLKLTVREPWPCF